MVPYMGCVRLEEFVARTAECSMALSILVARTAACSMALRIDSSVSYCFEHTLAVSILSWLLPLVVAQEYDTNGSGEIGEKQTNVSKCLRWHLERERKISCSNIHSRERACAKGCSFAFTQTKLSSSI